MNPAHARTKNDRILRAPADRPSCGSVSGANKHYAEREALCGGCEMAIREHTRLSNARLHGTKIFSRLPAKWSLDEPLAEWRLLQTEELDDGPYISGPWYKRIRVPKAEVEGGMEPGSLYEIRFENGGATYQVHHQTAGFVCMEIVKGSILSWMDLIEGER